MGRMGHVCGPAAMMDNQFNVTRQACSGIPQKPERHPLAPTSYDAFVTSAYHQK